MLRELIKKTPIGKLIKESYGDWRYPFMAAGWCASGWLSPRRKVKIGNVSFTLPCNNWITHFRWYLFKTKEKEVRRFIDEHVKEGDIFFDIGANIGVFSIYAGMKQKGISIYCFEPEFSNLNLLKENVIQNGLAGKVQIYGVAISDAEGLSQLHIQDVTPGAACHTESRQPIAITDEGFPVVWKEGVATMTLDQICKLLDVTPNAIKIDTDGNEAKILRGAVHTLKKQDLRVLAIEMPLDSNQSKYCSDILRSAGFSLSWSDSSKTRNEIWKRI